MKIRFTLKALAQLDAIFSYIARADASAAARVKARILRSIERLARLPYSARPTDLPGVRVLAVGKYPYLVFYSVDETAQEVHILRVRHTAQDPRQNLE